MGKRLTLLKSILLSLLLLGNTAYPATLSRGKTFTANEEVTNTKLHTLVDSGSISNIVQTDIGSGYGLLYRSISTPSDTDTLWFDSVNNLLKVYGSSAYIEIPTISSPSSGNLIRYDGTHWVGYADTSYVTLTDTQTITGTKTFNTGGAPFAVSSSTKVTNLNADTIDGYSSAGMVVQVVNTQTGAIATGTTAVPDDDTIPQITEGDEYMTLAITPTSATNKLKIDVVWNGHNTNTGNMCVALFQDTTANALAAVQAFREATNRPEPVCFTHYMTSGTTSETTFRVRAGGATGATTTFNGAGGARKLGGVIASSITITEIAQ